MIRVMDIHRPDFGLRQVRGVGGLKPGHRYLLREVGTVVVRDFVVSGRPTGVSLPVQFIGSGGDGDVDLARYSVTTGTQSLWNQKNWIEDPNMPLYGVVAAWFAQRLHLR